MNRSVNRAGNTMREQLIPGLIFAAVAGSAASADATVIAHARALSRYGTPEATDTRESGSADVLASAVLAGAAASASHGVIKVSAAASDSLGVGEMQFGGDALAEASWHDFIILHTRVPGVASGFINGLMDVRGLASAAAGDKETASAVFEYAFSASTGRSLGISAVVTAPGGIHVLTVNGKDVTPKGTVAGVYEVSIPFSVSSPISLSSFARCAAGAVEGEIQTSPPLALCEFGSSIYWAGVQSVTDADGNVLDDWTLTSQSGTDYTKSFAPDDVPEPRTLGLLGLALLSLAALRSPGRQRA